MRMVIQPSLCEHVGSTRCERCLPNSLEQHRTGYCVMEESEDGLEGLTLVILDTTGNLTEEVLLNSPEQVEAFLSERGINLPQA